MIAITELRVGNLVSDVWASPHSMYPVVLLGAKSCKYGGVRSGKPLSCSYSNLMPIPITINVLQKAGFVNLSGYVSDVLSNSDGSCSVQIRGNKARVWVDDIDLDRFQEVKSMHQLQNLYFALTGKELDIKL